MILFFLIGVDRCLIRGQWRTEEDRGQDGGRRGGGGGGGFCGGRLLSLLVLVKGKRKVDGGGEEIVEVLDAGWFV